MSPISRKLKSVGLIMKNLKLMKQVDLFENRNLEMISIFLAFYLLWMYFCR